MTQHLELARPIIAILGASGAWLGKHMIADASPPPDSGWLMILDKYGLPLVLLGLCIYGGLGLFKALRASEAARLQDAKEMNAQYRLDVIAGEASRKEMLKELQEQTRTMREKP